MIVDENIAIDHGLKKIEYEKICKFLNRIPNITELGLFSAMWNEHCSYKSSKIHLKKLPTTGKKVIQGPGENAGVIDIGDDDAIVFKIESHNHPSFIEPSSPDKIGSTNLSGCGIIPKMFFSLLKTPAMFLLDPFGLNFSFVSPFSSQ